MRQIFTGLPHMPCSATVMRCGPGVLAGWITTPGSLSVSGSSIGSAWAERETKSQSNSPGSRHTFAFTPERRKHHCPMTSPSSAEPSLRSAALRAPITLRVYSCSLRRFTRIIA